MATAERRVGSARRGMTLLGKIPAAPKPINLPSQRLENQGHVPHVERGTFSWGGLAGQLNSSGCKSANTNKNENVTKSENDLASNKKGEGLVEKNTQHLPTESNTSLPSSAVRNRSDVTSSICFNSASTESLDGDIKVDSGSTLDDESRGSTKNAKIPTHSTSGPENTNISLDNANKLEDPAKSRADAWVQGHKQVSDPEPLLNKDEGKSGDSKQPTGPGYSCYTYNSYPHFLMPGMPYAPGTYNQHHGPYGVSSMPFYSDAKGREVVIIHMYGNPGFYGGFFPQPGFSEHYSRPHMYSQYPLQFGQFEPVYYPEHEMGDGASQSTNSPFFREQYEFAQYGHENYSDEWAKENMSKDTHVGEAGLPAPTSAIEIMPRLPKHGMSKKAGRSHWNVKGICTKASDVVSLPGRRVTLLTKVSQHEIIIDSLCKKSQDSGTESPTTTLANLPVSPHFGKEAPEDEGMEKALTGTSVSDKAVDDCAIPSLTSEVYLPQTGAPKTIRETPGAKTTCHTLCEDNSTRVPSPALAEIHVDEHSVISSKILTPIISPGSVLDSSCHDTKGKTSQETGPSKDKDYFIDCIQTPKDALDMDKQKCRQRGFNALNRDGGKREYKLFTAKSKMGRKMFVAKIQRFDLTKKRNNIDDRVLSKTQTSISEVISQSTMCCTESLPSEKLGKEGCGSKPAMAAMPAEGWVKNMNLSKDKKSFLHNLCGSDSPSLLIPDEQDRNIKLEKVSTTGSLTDLHVLVASDESTGCGNETQNSTEYDRQVERRTNNKYLKERGPNTSVLVPGNRKWGSQGFARRVKVEKKVFVPKVEKVLKHKIVDIRRTDAIEIQELTKEIVLPQTFILEATMNAQSLVDGCNKQELLSKVENIDAISEPEGKDAKLRTCSSGCGMPLVEDNAFPSDNLCPSISLDSHALNAQSKKKEKKKVQKKAVSVSGYNENITKSGTSQDHSENEIEDSGHENKKVQKNNAFSSGSYDTRMKPSKSRKHLKYQVKGECGQNRADKNDIEIVESGDSHEHLENQVKASVQHEDGTSYQSPTEWKHTVSDAFSRKWEVKQPVGKTDMNHKIFMPKIRKDLRQIYAPKKTVKLCCIDVPQSKSEVCPVDLAPEPKSKVFPADVVSLSKPKVCLESIASHSESSIKKGPGSASELRLDISDTANSLGSSPCDGLSKNITGEEDERNGCYISFGMQKRPSENDQLKDHEHELKGTLPRFQKCQKEWRPKLPKPRSSTQQCKITIAQKEQ